MRFGFGLISLLLVLVVAMMIFKNFEAPAIEASKPAKEEAEQISGHDDNGMAAMDSYTAEPYPADQFKGIKIDTVAPGGPMDAFYGLKPGDIVRSINGNGVDILGGDYGTAKASLDEAFQRSEPLQVDRNGQSITLPAAGTPAAAKVNDPMGLQALQQGPH